MASDFENPHLASPATAKSSAAPGLAELPAEERSALETAALTQEYAQLRDRFARTTNALASAAHDLKTPLSILNGYIELLRSEKLGGLNDRQREILQDMHANGHRLQHFIQDFLTFSVLETGEMKMRFTENDMNACLSEVCQLWSNRFQEKGLALYFLGNEKLSPFPFD